MAIEQQRCHENVTLPLLTTQPPIAILNDLKATCEPFGRYAIGGRAVAQDSVKKVSG